MSDLHLEAQEFHWPLPRGDVLIIAGDLAHASCLDPARTDKYAGTIRDRVYRLAEAAQKSHRHVILVAGNHDHYDGIFEETIAHLRRALPGMIVLDDSHVEIGGTRFFGATLWTNFAGIDAAALDRVRRRLGEYFFVKTRRPASDQNGGLATFRPEDSAAAFSRAWRKLQETVSAPNGKRTVVITHHAPSLQGLNPAHVGNGLDCAYASNLDREIAAFEHVPFWVHGHTHIRRNYRIGATAVLANCRGFDRRDESARTFKPDAFFEV